MFNKESILFLLFSWVSLALGILITYLLSDYFSVADFGNIQFFITSLGILSIFYLSGYDFSIQKKIFKHDDTYVLYILKRIMPYSLVALLLLLFILRFIEVPHKNLIEIACIVTIFGIFDKFNSILNAKLMFKQMRYIELFTKILLLSTALVTIYFNFDYTQYIFIYASLYALIIIFRILYSLKLLDVGSKKDFNYDETTKEANITSASTIYTIIAIWIERFILGFTDTTLLGIFVIAQIIPRTIKDNVKVFLKPTVNTWAKKGFRYYSLMVKKYQVLLLLMGMASFVIVSIACDMIINAYFTKYTNAILYAQILSISLIIKFLEFVIMTGFSLSKHTMLFNKINTVTNTIKIVTSIILIPIFGIYGAITSILLFEITKSVIVYFSFLKLQNISIKGT